MDLTKKELKTIIERALTDFAIQTLEPWFKNRGYKFGAKKGRWYRLMLAKKKELGLVKK